MHYSALSETLQLGCNTRVWLWGSQFRHAFSMDLVQFAIELTIAKGGCGNKMALPLVTSRFYKPGFVLFKRSFDYDKN